MTKFSSPRLCRAAVGIAAVGAFALAPVAAHAADTDATGTLTTGGLTNSAPGISAFDVPLTGDTQTIHSEMGAWNVTDATGSNAGYTVTVAATAPTVAGTTAGAGTDPTLTLTPKTATPAVNNPATTGPVATSGGVLLSTTAATIDYAAAGTGQGEWDFAGDSSGNGRLAIVIPGDASVGAYTSTLTFTSAPLAG